METPDTNPVLTGVPFASRSTCSFFFFFFTGTATTEIYTLSLHDALPILDEARNDKFLNTNVGKDTSSGIAGGQRRDRKSTRLNSSHVRISYAVFCLKKKTIYGAAKLTTRLPGGQTADSLDAVTRPEAAPR